MRIQPRRETLGIWSSAIRSSLKDGAWVWGGRDGSNSISDAEQLLCLMAPSTRVASFRLERPDETADDVVRALGELGDRLEIPRFLVRVIREYFDRYTAEDGTPIFSGENYFVSGDPRAPISDAQRDLQVVDSFSMSITLALATIGFLQEYKPEGRKKEEQEEINQLRELASNRLSAAMVGLLRSFTVYVFSADSAEGTALIRTINQDRMTPESVVSAFRRQMQETAAGLRDLSIGSGATVNIEDSLHSTQLFECGWSWGIVKDAPEVVTPEQVGQQPDGVAEAAPYLYFTVVALDALQDLFSERTRILGLLNDNQQRLAQALQIRWDLTQAYWSKIAMFGDGAWPLEDIPWRTTDSKESDYFTLLVTSIVVHYIVTKDRSDAHLTRVGGVLSTLAGRSRITQRASLDVDAALAMHSPGVPFSLGGGEDRGGPPLMWFASDFGPQLLKRTISIAGLFSEPRRRQQFVDLADDTWDHLRRRRLGKGPGNRLWDQPALVFPSLSAIDHHEPSWYYTERIVECLVAAATLINRGPLPSERAMAHARDLLSEAEVIFDQELLTNPANNARAIHNKHQWVEEKLSRARYWLTRRPGTAESLAREVLVELDALVAARQDLSEAG
ncbi:SCO2524 family protein [Longispora sp. NPDC051575]|uniref:SCO2524 family protein n=1 Tax=Longispora sp. NPDC051575 TaxID=3154943 RepID=UPI003412354E